MNESYNHRFHWLTTYQTSYQHRPNWSEEISRSRGAGFRRVPTFQETYSVQPRHLRLRIIRPRTERRIRETFEEHVWEPVVIKLSLQRFNEFRTRVYTQPVCSICQTAYSSDEDITTIPCNHKFHKECIKRWLTERSVYCPLCRFDCRENNE